MLKNLSLVEKLVLGFVAIVTLAAFALSYIDEEFFEERFVVEDGFTEWTTVIVLAVGMIVCFRRVWLLRGQRPLSFLLMTTLLGLFFTFGAGEEISWGQRLFDIESSEFFVENNAQGETNLHNLVVNDVRINRVIFGRGLGIMLFLYLAVLIPLYRRKPAVQQFTDRFAIPIAANYQIAAYILLLLVVQMLMVSSKKGEMLEFSGSFIFLLNVVFPYNRSLFQADAKAAGETRVPSITE